MTLTRVYRVARSEALGLAKGSSRVEEGRGDLGAVRPSSRFPSPLIEPDVRISRIRLSDRLHGKTHDIAVFVFAVELPRERLELLALLGSSPIASPQLLREHARSEGPSLHRHYPASSVL